MSYEEDKSKNAIKCICFRFQKRPEKSTQQWVHVYTQSIVNSFSGTPRMPLGNKKLN